MSSNDLAVQWRRMPRYYNVQTTFGGGFHFVREDELLSSLTRIKIKTVFIAACQYQYATMHCYTMNTIHLPVFSLHDLFDNNCQDISGIIAVLDVHTKLYWVCTPSCIGCAHQAVLGVHTKLYYEPAGGTKW